MDIFHLSQTEKKINICSWFPSYFLENDSLQDTDFYPSYRYKASLKEFIYQISVICKPLSFTRSWPSWHQKHLFLEKNNEELPMPILSISYNNTPPPIRERGRELQFCLQLVLNISEKKPVSIYPIIFICFFYFHV